MKKKILIVDDEPAVCNMLEKFLVKKEFEVFIALSGEAGIEKLKKERPHMVLLDIKMPNMDGIETLKKMKELDKKVGIVMITAVKEDDVGKQCLKLGAYDYVTKPLGLDYLEKVLLVKLIDV